MIRFLGKFTIGGFLRDQNRGRIGMILANSTERQLCVRWLSGNTQEVSLAPSNQKEQKALNRFKKYRALSATDFNIQAGVPARVLKVLRTVEFIDVIIEALAIPNQHLNQEELTLEVMQRAEIAGVMHTEFSSQRKGDTHRILLRFWL